MASQSSKKRKLFFASSKLNDYILDVKSGEEGEGTPLIVWPKKDSKNDNQLFFEDRETGTIRSNMNGLCFDIDGDRIILNPYEEGKESQHWRIQKDDGTIRHRITSNLVFDIVGASKDEGASICAYEFHGEKNQLWTIEYIDSKSNTKEESSDSSDSDSDGKEGEPDPSQKPLTKEERKKRREERKAERKERRAGMSKEERKAEKEKRKAEKAARKGHKHKGKGRKKSGSGSD